MADKGLKSNVVGLFGGTMLGISSVAPAYTGTITIGLLAAAVGAQTPVVFIAGFLPMFFAAYAYREFNTIMPDAGTSFTWTSKGFGPYVGWLGGWAAGRRWSRVSSCSPTSRAWPSSSSTSSSAARQTRR